MLAVAHDARLDRPPEGAKDGIPQRVHLENAARRGVKAAVAALEGPGEPPAEIAYLRDWYDELARGRSYNGMTGTPNPITYSEVDAWARLTQRAVTPEEVNALLRLDSATLHPDAYLKETA